jgi:hypothetical protein
MKNTKKNKVNKKKQVVVVPNSTTVIRENFFNSPYYNRRVLPRRDFGWIEHFNPGVHLSAASTFAFVSLKLNDAWSPSTSVFASASGGGWAYRIVGYSQFKVDRAIVEVDIVNNEPSVPIAFAMVLNDQLPAPITFADVIDMITRGNSVGPLILSETTANPQRQVPRLDSRLRDIVGSNLIYDSNLEYAGATSGVAPAQLVYLTLIAYSVTGANIANGLFASLRLKQYTEFFGILSEI